MKLLRDLALVALGALGMATLPQIGEVISPVPAAPELAAVPFQGTPFERDLPQRKLSYPIRCEQFVAQWGPGEIPRPQCVDADLSKR